MPHEGRYPSFSLASAPAALAKAVNMTSTACPAASQPDMTHPFTKHTHRTTYPAISPDNPALSVRGKIVLITGGSHGIGLATAFAFAAAKAAHIIIVARERMALVAARTAIEEAHPETSVHIFPTAITDTIKVKTMFARVHMSIGEPDIMVLCAGRTTVLGPTLCIPADCVWADFEVNVKGNLDFLTEFLRPETSSGKQKVAINVSSAAANQVLLGTASYGASKLAFMYMCMHLQAEPAGHNVRFMNFHPGAIFTHMAEELGMTEDMMAWEDPSLSGSFALWLASDAAAFLAGRFVYATWDVEELVARKDEILGGNLLTMGLIGQPVSQAGSQAQDHGHICCACVA